MTSMTNIPSATYGILQQAPSGTALDQAAEQVRNLGYAILDSGYTAAEMEVISDAFDRTRAQYIRSHSEEKLRDLNEIYILRALLTHGGETFLKLAFNENLIAVIKMLIPGKFVLNQQNGVINPPQEPYNQGAWHRDLPYQHYVSTKPLAVNALFCIDEFTFDNGGTFVLPASHKSEPFPSQHYLTQNATQAKAKAGSFILLDCMIFHAGGYNKTRSARRAVNHVFTIPYFKQQINLPKNMDASTLAPEQREILGFSFAEPVSIEAYLSSRSGKTY